MMALPCRWRGVTREATSGFTSGSTSSALVTARTDHLLEDGGKVVTDAGLPGGGQAGPDSGRVAGHGGTSPDSARAIRSTKSATAARVSLVGSARSGRGAARLVAPTGRRK